MAQGFDNSDTGACRADAKVHASGLRPKVPTVRGETLHNPLGQNNLLGEWISGKVEHEGTDQ